MPTDPAQPVGTTVRLHRGGDTATLTLTPPAPPGKPPTLDHPLLNSLDAAIAELEADPPRLAVLRSATPKYFCVGANLHALRAIDEQTIRPWVEHGHRVVNRLEDLPCPTVARVAGYAVGGGLELAMACDLIFAEAGATLGLTEARLGFIPGWGGCRRFVERVGVAAAKRHFFAGRTMDAAAAAGLGLVDFVGDAAAVDAELAAFADEVSQCSRYAVSTFKRIVDAERRAARDRNLDAEATHSVGCLREPDAADRLAAFLDRKKG